LIAGLIVAISSYIFAAYTQFAAGNFLGNISDHIYLQFAGSFISHFLPFNLGGINLLTRYFKKHGESQATSIIFSSIPLIFGIITTVVLVLIISPITLIHYFNQLHSIHLNNWELPVVVAIVIMLIVLSIIYGSKIKHFFLETVDGIKSIQNVRQLSYLLAGSLCITISTTGALFFSVLAIHHSASIIAIFVLYVTSSLVSNVAPTPGGIGATEAFLVVGLVAMKLTLPDAAAVTLIYRFLTFWFPIIPGGIALHIVNKRKIV
jgi:undecaprenyl-diphosphatase